MTFKEPEVHDFGATMSMNAKTGAFKQTKPERFDLVPADVIKLLALLYGKGAEYYDARNWEKGYDWSLSFAACQRHLWAFWNGEDLDPTSGLPHVLHAAWHAIALTHYGENEEKYKEFDDRPSTREQAP